MSRVISQPERGHHCGVNDHGFWWEVRGDVASGGTYFAEVGLHEPPGTVRECEGCGRTWVALPEQVGLLVTRWRREGRIERWWRERRHR